MDYPPEKKQDDVQSGSGMPFLDHLEELRWRILKSLVAIIVMALASFYFSDQLFRFIIAPLGDVKLHFTEVTGSFYAYLKVSLIVGLLASLPVVFYQLWSFVSPGLYKQEKAMILPLVITSTGLFLLGAAFCYYGVLPIALKFLIGFGDDLLSPIITVSSYISFAGMLLVAFGLGFELPIATYMLAKMGLVSPQAMARARRYAIVGILIIGAILTPPDVFTQVLLAGPVYILYEISIIVARVAYPKKKNESDES